MGRETKLKIKHVRHFEENQKNTIPCRLTQFQSRLQQQTPAFAFPPLTAPHSQPPARLRLSPPHTFAMGSNKPRGLHAARKLRVVRKQNRWADKAYKKGALGNIYKTSPTMGSSHASGIVLEKVVVEAKQPNSAIRKCVRVQLIKVSSCISHATMSLAQPDKERKEDHCLRSPGRLFELRGRERLRHRLFVQAILL